MAKKTTSAKKEKNKKPVKKTLSPPKKKPIARATSTPAKKAKSAKQSVPAKKLTKPSAPPKTSPASKPRSPKKQEKAASKNISAASIPSKPAVTSRTGLRPTAKDAARDLQKRNKTAVVATPKPVPAPVVSKPAGRASTVKPLSREFLFELANSIRQAVVPCVRNVKGREVIGHATSGDATFEIDRIAEKALLNFLKEVKAPVAYYSEDAGYTTFSSGQPQHLLVVDPIDGTRAAKCGFESCVVSVGCTRVIERPRMGDIESACVMEVIGDRTFYAERGKGTRIYTGDAWKKPTLSQNANLETMSWAMTVPARPADLIFPTAAKLIDLTSLKGGFFACNSTSFSLTRLLTNQLDACVDIANRYLRDIPAAVEGKFINAGRGIILGIAPYDIAASLLIAQEAGCIVTDAYGKGFDDILLLDSSVANHQSMLAASNAELHNKLLSFFDMRMRQYELLLSRRAGTPPPEN